MFFKPTAEVLSATVTKKEDLATCLDAAPTSPFWLDSNTLEVIHVVAKSLDMNRLFDPNAIASLAPYLKPGAELTVHVLANEGEKSGEDDSETVKMSLVLAGLRIESEEEAADGSRTLTAKKAGGDLLEEVEEDDDEDDDEEDEVEVVDEKEVEVPVEEVPVEEEKS